MTHADLVAAAARWLKGQGCGIVLTEHRGGTEEPDAIGWRRASESIMVECKVSVADFYADAKKAWRLRHQDRLADLTYYLTPPELLKTALPAPRDRFEMPDGWGLLETTGRGVTIVIPCLPALEHTRTPHGLRRERDVLYRELRRYKAQGITYDPLSADPQPTARQMTPENHARVCAGLSPGRAAIMRVLMACYPKSLDRAVLAAQLEVTPRSSVYQQDLSALRESGLLAYPAPGRVVARQWFSDAPQER